MNWRTPRRVLVSLYCDCSERYANYLPEMLDRLPDGATSIRIITMCSYSTRNEIDRSPIKREEVALAFSTNRTHKLRKVIKLNTNMGIKSGLGLMLMPYVPQLKNLVMDRSWEDAGHLLGVDVAESLSKSLTLHSLTLRKVSSQDDVGWFATSKLERLKIDYANGNYALPWSPHLRYVSVSGKAPRFDNAIPLLEELHIIETIVPWVKTSLPSSLRRFWISFEKRSDADPENKPSHESLTTCYLDVLQSLPPKLLHLYVECRGGPSAFRSKKNYYIECNYSPCAANTTDMDGNKDKRPWFRAPYHNAFPLRLQTLWIGTRFLLHEMCNWPPTVESLYAVDSHVFFHPNAVYPYACNLASLWLDDVVCNCKPIRPVKRVDFNDVFPNLQHLVLQENSMVMPTGFPDSLQLLFILSKSVPIASCPFPRGLKALALPSTDADWERENLAALPRTLRFCDLFSCSHRALEYFPDDMNELEAICCMQDQLHHVSVFRPNFTFPISLRCLAVNASS